MASVHRKKGTVENTYIHFIELNTFYVFSSSGMNVDNWVFLKCLHFYYRVGLKNELGEATEKGDVDKVKSLMGKVSVDTDLKIKREGLGKSPLMIACTYGQEPVVKEFLQV